MRAFTYRSILLLTLILMGGSSKLSNGSEDVLKESLTFSRSELVFSKLKGYDQVFLAGCDLTANVGEPQLPVRLVNLVIPDGARVEEVEILATESEELPGSYLLYPVQPPQILSKAGPIPFVEPKSQIYSSSLYPQEIVEYRGSGSLSGYQVTSFLVYPLQYLPLEKSLRFHSQIDFAVRFSSGPKPSPTIKRSERVERFIQRTVGSLVLNPQDIREIQGIKGKSSTLLPPGGFEYVIITGESYVPYFQPLADWKMKKGTPAVIVTTDSIYANCSGQDNQEKIRNFIKDAYQNRGTVWVLLGGDTGIIPTRLAYAMDCETGNPADNDIPCDLYYSDLDGTWDLNGNHIYGEVADSVDMLSDVFVGRASVSTHQEAQAWVSKVLTYEKNPPTDYQLDMLFAAEILWWDPYTDSGVGKNMIDDLFVPPRFDPITKLYESQGNESRASVMAAMNEGQNIINHDGHAWYTVMGVGNYEYLGISDMDALHNGPRNSILFSIGCWPAAFDFDCIAEHFVNNPDGGGVAYIGNSRYGWGSPGNPGYGYSDRFDNQFYRFLFQDDIYHIGATLAFDKAFYVPRSQQENVYRWCEYEINLLGDPEMPIWTDTPQNLMVEHPDSIPTGESLFPVTVMVNSSPLSEASVCLMNQSGLYEQGITGANGQISFSIQPTTQETLWVTVTAHNHLPYEGYTTVFSNGPWVGRYWEAIFDTIVGNGDGVINPGEEISLAISLKNYGNQSSDSVTGVLTTDDPMATVLDSLGDYGEIPPGDSSQASGYRFFISPDCPNGRVISFGLGITDAAGNSWEERLNFTVANPILGFQTYLIDDGFGGDGDSIPEPGESFSLGLSLKNVGLGLARGVTAKIWVEDPYVSLTDTIADFGGIWPDSLSDGTYEMSISPSCPTPRFPPIFMEILTEDGYCFSDSLILTVGETGFSDDMEAGPGEWSPSWLWGLSTHRSHSGTHSWYCGDTSHAYQNNMNSPLITPLLVLAPNSSLIFWHWYDVTTYGVDGLYVEIVKGSTVDTLDFIGSGGALDSLLIGNNWLKENYDLSSYGFGDTVQVKFTFVSDGNKVAEGFYIDDVNINGSYSVSVGTTDGGHSTTRPTLFQLCQNYPNPFNSATHIRYTIPDRDREGRPHRTTLKVYNVLGQEVRTLVDGVERAGIHKVIWDGRDNRGREVTSGVYLYRLKMGHISQTRKLVLLK